MARATWASTAPPRQRADRRLHAFDRLPVLLLALLVSGCDGEGLPPLQQVPLEGDARAVERLSGSWYDSSGVQLVGVHTRSPARLELRLPRQHRLDRAWVENGELYVEILDEEGTYPGWVRFFRDETLVLVPPGAEPSWCGTCTPRLRRYPAAWMADPRLQELDQLPRRAYDDAIDWLAEVL